jgi:hypothetical protein
MGNPKDTFGALAVIALLGSANALVTNATEYAAPTVVETEADILVQQIRLCDAGKGRRASLACFCVAPRQSEHSPLAH